VLDVGANKGDFSKSLRRINKNIDIYSFEPHPVTFKKLSKNIEGLNITSLNLGVGGMPGTLSLYDYANQDGSEHASVYQDVIEAIHGEKAIKHDIQVVTLDEFVKLYKIDEVILLKIDTEGHELEVLKGFTQFINDNKVYMIHFEFNEMNVISRVFFKDFWDMLPNYSFYRLLPNSLIPIKNYNPLLCEIFAYQNIVAILKHDSQESPE
jgi:FkbM family methyltransferase